MEKKKIVKVTMSDFDTAYFVEGLYPDADMQDTVIEALQKEFPTAPSVLSDANEVWVLDADAFDWWWDLAWQTEWDDSWGSKWTLAKNVKRTMSELTAGGIITGLEMKFNGGCRSLFIDVVDEPLEFHGETVELVRRVNGGRFLNVPYKTATLNLATLMAMLERIAKEHPELLGKPVKVEEYWDADEEIQDVYSVSAEDGCTLINKGRNEE